MGEFVDMVSHIEACLSKLPANPDGAIGPDVGPGDMQVLLERNADF